MAGEGEALSDTALGLAETQILGGCVHGVSGHLLRLPSKR